MFVEDPGDAAVSTIAACIAEPARRRMLYCLMDGHARTGTELALVGGVSPSTASAHLSRLKAAELVKVIVQGKHRYYSLSGRSVARALEGLSVVAGRTPNKFVPNTPMPLRAARTCYDHIAGRVGVLLHHRLRAQRWLTEAYEVTPAGSKGLTELGIDLDAAKASRRRFAYACLDWSERQPHLAGALGSAMLGVALKRRWMTAATDSRALDVTRSGRQALLDRLGVEL